MSNQIVLLLTSCLFYVGECANSTYIYKADSAWLELTRDKPMSLFIYQYEVRGLKENLITGLYIAPGVLGRCQWRII